MYVCAARRVKSTFVVLVLQCLVIPNDAGTGLVSLGELLLLRGTYNSRSLIVRA
jgi:hypothetical protein